MFWNSDKSNNSGKDFTSIKDNIKDDGPHTDNNEIRQMESLLDDVINDKKSSSSLRNKASNRAESLELSKFPVSSGQRI